MDLNLFLGYEVNGKAVAVGRCRNPRMVREVARLALNEKRNQVALLGRFDAGLGTVALGELECLENTLRRMVPGMKGAA
jgi:hypothetical protein